MANKHRIEDYHPEDYNGVRYWTRAEIEAVFTEAYLERLHQASRQVALAHRFGWGLVDPTVLIRAKRQRTARKE